MYFWPFQVEWGSLNCQNDENVQKFEKSVIFGSFRLFLHIFEAVLPILFNESLPIPCNLGS